ncbi:MAG: DNA-directed RNA polymerase subunit beta' [Candidatus Berkelbacteria bacterium Licking1014_2]|uniref:DNA-directed RNA polymerase subunit beta' n=1 Tax=Candidatus Berkelbacteria bacterium Licking1014_2 TaxID=2017146 RepID=A0A554LVX6_9BACT|nr:MAG: DNA-directed RNA polymerase subunit beta' [Candidatus Berkelbacteria bacterium Licking1014_2]
MNKPKVDAKQLYFEALRLSVASPEQILGWSHGEVLKPETINYRSQRPERDGLFCERIFGPSKDWECYCGKYKGIRYKGVVCDKCGVEITRSSVRRERMGHIDLMAPVAHIWYLRGVPSTLGLILDLPLSELEKVIYFSAYIILSVNEEQIQKATEDLNKEFEALKPEKKGEELTGLEIDYKTSLDELKSLRPGKVLSEQKYFDMSLKYGDIVKVGIGAEAIDMLLRRLNLDQEIERLMAETKGGAELKEKRRLNRLHLLINLKRAKIEPHWLILKRLPILAPGLRPMVQLDGGRFAASDLNDLYRRVINRNNRLRRLKEQGAPEVIYRNEKRMLQEAVDSLIDNSARRTAKAGGQAAAKLRSLSDILRGKQGRFRQNLLGKRVDYSGRSVIVIGPELQLDQCGLPKIMALELFKTFVISRLISDGFVHNVKNAVRMIERQTPEVWDILEDITKDYYILLNRAPTLHRLGIQAFKPVLIEGKAIRIHPLVCYAFNADFDGDQMAVHIPLSQQSRREAAEIMRSSYNLLKPSSGQPVVSPRLDIIFGCYWLTSMAENAPGEGRVFANKEEAILAEQAGACHLRAKIQVRLKEGEKPIETTIGRLIFNGVLPAGSEFINKTLDEKTLRGLIEEKFHQLPREAVVKLVDDVKNLGFYYATLSGITIAIDDVYIPPKKKDIINRANRQVEEIEKQYDRGLITDSEKSAKSIELWTMAKTDIEKELISGFAPDNPLLMMAKSGARGSMTQMAQLGGMKGLVVSPTGDIIEVPIRANYREGLDVLEYFISTHGARKGKSDTSLRTSDAGYLTRRLVDVAQNLVITKEDCQVKEGILIKKPEAEMAGVDFCHSLIGRVASQNIIRQKGKKIVGGGEEISEKNAKEIERAGIEEVAVRSPIKCQLDWGICQKCYGRDLATGKMVEIGAVVGIIAAQAIGEPGTQLTMKTFHTGGVSGEDITTGLPRVEEILEVRPPRGAAVLSELTGAAKISEVKDEKIIEITADTHSQNWVQTIPDGWEILIKNGDTVKRGQHLAKKDKEKIKSGLAGQITIGEKDGQKKFTVFPKDYKCVAYRLPKTTRLKIQNGEKVMMGQELTDGHLNLRDALKLKGRDATIQYILRGVQEIYTSQGQQINDKHIEIIIRQMFSQLKVLEPGGSNLSEGQVISRNRFLEINTKLDKQGKNKVKAEGLLLGITRAALNTDSFLAAASFQETTSILVGAALRGAVDELRGLKENVIIGRLIPAGTSFQK